MRIIIFLVGLCILMTYMSGCVAGGPGGHGGGWDHHDDHGDSMMTITTIIIKIMRNAQSAARGYS